MRPKRKQANQPEANTGSPHELPVGLPDKSNPRPASKDRRAQPAPLAVKVARTSPLQRRLFDSEARYRQLFETSQDGIVIVDPQTGLVIEVNPFLMNLLHYPAAFFVGKELWQLGLFADEEACRHAFLKLKATRYVRFEDVPLRMKDGGVISVELVSNLHGVKGRQLMQCNIRDISARKKTEETGQWLLRAQKMEALGQLVGGVAHDFNNLLQVILGYSEMLQQCADVPESARTMIATIQDTATSAKTLTHRLLGFSRQQVLQPVMLDLNEAVNRIRILLAGVIGADVIIESHLESGLGAIKADPQQIEQVLMNLAINARDAMPGGGKIIFETANVAIDDTHISQQSPMKPGRYVKLVVRDTGIGMDPETQRRIFELFFTTKGVDKGTGLGLHSVSSIVRQSGGAIDVSSQQGHGTTFSLYFPRRESAPTVALDAEPDPLLGGTETILLVEDAPSSRILVRTLLERRGYTVLYSGDPEEALRIAREFNGTLPLMITDLIMPGFSGRVLAERIALHRPETKVIYTSGDPEESAARHGIGQSHHAFLEKPFSGDELVRIVRRVLDQPDRRSA
jgi:PAS domain S-box-containing protein